MGGKVAHITSATPLLAVEAGPLLDLMRICARAYAASVVAVAANPHEAGVAGKDKEVRTNKHLNGRNRRNAVCGQISQTNK